MGVYVNVILRDTVDELWFVAPARERAVEIVRAPRAAGILATVRRSAGGDAEAACGQLRRIRSAAG